MIPENFKDILSNEQNTGFYQSLALVLFIIFFAAIIFYVFSRPKKHYDDAASAPLNDDE